METIRVIYEQDEDTWVGDGARGPELDGGRRQLRGGPSPRRRWRALRPRSRRRRREALRSRACRLSQRGARSPAGEPGGKIGLGFAVVGGPVEQGKVAPEQGFLAAGVCLFPLGIGSHPGGHGFESRYIHRYHVASAFRPMRARDAAQTRRLLRPEREPPEATKSPALERAARGERVYRPPWRSAKSRTSP